MTLGPLQQALLTVLCCTTGELTTIEIYETLRGKYKPLSLASIFITLDRMSRKGLVTSRKSDPLPERGGKARLLYKITKNGRAALRQMENMRAAVGTLKPFPVA
jgi:PadR family transcriptional regulator, regulatory protein PadR